MQTLKRVKERIETYERDLISCLYDIESYPCPESEGEIALVEECERRISYFIPALVELYWFCGVERNFRRQHYDIVMCMRSKEPMGISEISLRTHIHPTKVGRIIDDIHMHGSDMLHYEVKP